MRATPTRSRWLTALVAAALLGGVLWLRAPGFAHPIWNVDEAIHAAIARTLLDGGVLYRDAIDQRTPLTYYVMAGVFALAGPNNLWAVHLFTALVVAVTAGLLFLLMRRWAGWAAGLWAAGLYALLSGGLLYQGDANACVTEWFVALFSTAAAAVYWQTRQPGGGRHHAAAGALLALAFLSKQPALLDLGAPLLVSVWLATRPGGGWRRILLSSVLPLLGGWLLPVLAVAVYFALHHALRPLIFYTWTYNLTYYGPEISGLERAASGFIPFRMLAEFAPALLLPLLLTAGTGLHALAQRQPTPGENQRNPIRLYVLAWLLGALVGGASGGRGFDHYFIPLLPPLALAVAGMLGRWTEGLFHPGGSWLRRVAALLFLAVLLHELTAHTLTARHRTLADDPSLRAANFIRATTLPTDTIFVWGYHPDLYLLSDRRPASRFVYASFLTGLIPWTNGAEDRDTAYAIVPGAMDELLADLERSRPVFVVDCSAGPNRYWQKYPLGKFPRLGEFLRAHYVVMEPGQFIPQGFRLYHIKDSYRRSPPGSPAGAAAPAPRAGGAEINGPPFVEARPGPLAVSARDPAGRLIRLDLLLDERLLDSVSFPPCSGINLAFDLPFNEFRDRHVFVTRAISSDGLAVRSAPHETDTRQALLGAGELAAFALPVFQGGLTPVEISAPFGAQVFQEEGATIYFAHAPARLLYSLPAGARAVRGAMGFREGAYAASNPSPTEGAEFRLDWVKPDGTRVNLHHRLLRPRENPSDRGLIPFFAAVPAGATGSLEFVIAAGPTGSFSSAWTYWANLAVETSR